MNHVNTASSCRCPHHIVAPILIILLGIVFLLQNYSIITDGLVAQVWPFFLLAYGISKLFAGHCKCYANAS